MRLTDKVGPLNGDHTERRTPLRGQNEITSGRGRCWRSVKCQTSLVSQTLTKAQQSGRYGELLA